MSYLLFLDESGHDHRNTPYEVRGGIAIHAGKLWSFVRSINTLQESCFGDLLERQGVEIKGSKQLSAKRWRHACSEPPIDALARRESALEFLRKTRAGLPASRREFAA